MCVLGLRLKAIILDHWCPTEFIHKHTGGFSEISMCCNPSRDGQIFQLTREDSEIGEWAMKCSAQNGAKRVGHSDIESRLERKGLILETNIPQEHILCQDFCWAVLATQ